MDEKQQGIQLIQSEEDKKKAAGQKAGLAQPGSAFSAGPSTSPTGSTVGAKPSPTGPVSPSASQQARAVQEAGPTKGTGFTGVGRYLQANIGSRLGEQVAGRIAQTGQQAQTRLGQAVGQFGQQLGQQQQQLSQQQQLAQGALQRISSGEQPQVISPIAQKTGTIAPIVSPLKEPAQEVGLTPSQQEIAAYSAIAGGQFAAPTGLGDISDIQTQARLAGQLGEATRTGAGRAGLLQQVVGRGPQQYTKGQSALDALILGQAGGQLAQARRASAGLERQATTQERLAEEQARQFGTQTEAAKRALMGQAAGLESPLKSDIEKSKEEFLKSRSTLESDLSAALAKGELTSEQAKILGITEPVKTYGLQSAELSNLLRSGISPADVTAQSISTPEQAAKLNALYKLMGQKEFATAEQLQKAGTTRDYTKGFTIDQPALERQKEQSQNYMKDVSKDLESRLGSLFGPEDNFKSRDEFLSSLKKDEFGHYDPSSIKQKSDEAKAVIEQLKPKFSQGFGIGEMYRIMADQLQKRSELLDEYLQNYSSVYDKSIKIKD